MPVIEKQNNQPIDPSKIENPIDRITAVKNLVRKGLRISIYGEPKTGKTRLVATFPKPVLIIGTEDGTDSIKNIDGVDFVQIKHTREIEPLVKHANTKRYATCALDTITSLQNMIYTEMLGLESIPLQRSAAAFASIDNQEYSFNTKRALNHMFEFTGNVIFTAHERDHTKKEEKGKSAGSELLMPRVGSSISTGVAGWLNGICDHVCQTFKREQVIMEQAGEGITVPVPTGKGEYCLRIGPHPIYMAGCRIPLGAQMPDVIVNPNYQKLKEVIDGKWKPPAEGTKS